MVYCQNCGKDTAGSAVTFYGNVLCGEACRKDLSERLYFRDTPPEPGSVWYCPHCGGQNPMGDPRKQLRPNCAQCGKPLDPASAAPRKQGCLSLLLLLAAPLALWSAGLAFPACTSEPEIALRTEPAGPPTPRPAATQDAAAARRAAQARQARQAEKQAAPDRTPEEVVNRRMEARYRRLRGAPGDSTQAGEVVAVGPADPQPASGEYLRGAKFEPPLGRVLQGMGQWEEANETFLRAIDDPGLQPAAQLLFLPIGDWPRPWDRRVNATREGMADMKARGYIPHLDISLFGLGADDEQVGVDSALVGSDRYDGRVRDLARAVRSIEGPVLLRIGGEFNGDWSPYTAFDYPAAYRKIVEIFRAEGVTNAAYIWCYHPDGPADFADVDPERGARWYPGDDVVDWFGLDVFDADDFSGPRERDGTLLPAGRSEAFLRMALEHGKPVIVAEASPAFVGLTPDPADGESDWNAWFAPFFRFLEANPNIQAFHYISVDWSRVGHYGEMGWKDARIEVNPLITERFREELRKPRYLHSGHTELLNGVAALPPAVPTAPVEPSESDPAPRR
jgi:hypothetical protein